MKVMTKVWFRCNGKNETLFRLNSCREIDYVPMVGDIIQTSNKDFQKATYRVKPFNKEKGIAKDAVCLDFKVVKRTYCTSIKEWELICEPTSDSLLFLLKKLDTR
jgi:hypothetical protein